MLCFLGPMKLLRAEEEALRDLAALARVRFGDRLRELKLFGSRARGEGNEDSDLDVLLVVDDLTGAEARALGHDAGDLLTTYDVIVVPFALSTARWLELCERERLITREIARDGVSL